MNPIPDERDILKTALWQRIDDTGTNVHAAIKDLANRLDGLETRVAAQVGALLDKSLVQIDRARLTLGSDLSESFKRLSTENEELAGRFDAGAKKQMVDLDAQLKAFRGETLQAIAKEVGDRLAEMRRQFSDLQDKTNHFQVEMAKTDQKNQSLTTEAIQKLAAAVQDFSDRLSRAAKILG